MKKKVVYTIGHSTRSITDFIDILHAYNIALLIDIRTVPRSRHNPQFNSLSLSKSLAHDNIGYVHASGLGGFRRPLPDSPNTGWRLDSFRGYADYMMTKEFQQNLQLLIQCARKVPIAIMCSEAVPWRCHRRLVADALITKNFDVRDIFSISLAKKHLLTPWSKKSKKGLLYPSPKNK